MDARNMLTMLTEANANSSEGRAAFINLIMMAICDHVLLNNDQENLVRRRIIDEYDALEKRASDELEKMQVAMTIGSFINSCK